jgi:putative cell wall-binding protein
VDHRRRIALVLAWACIALAVPARALAQPASAAATSAPRIAVVWSQISYEATMPPISAGATLPIPLGGPLYSSRVKSAQALIESEWGAEAVTRIGDGELADLAALEQFDVVVLARQVATTRAMRATMRDYVARGGSLVCSFGTGRWDFDPARTRPYYPTLFLGNSNAWEWGELSELLQVGFVNDPPMIAGFHVETHPTGRAHPIVTRAAAEAGVPSLDMTAGVSDCCELVRTLPPGPSVTPLVMYDHATLRNPDGSRRAVSGSLAGWVSDYHLGRIVYFGFQLHDLARGGAYASAGSQRQAERLMINAVRWAIEDRTYGPVVKSASLTVTGVMSGGKLKVTGGIRNGGSAQLNGRVTLALYDPAGAYRGGSTLRNGTTIWPRSTFSPTWTMGPTLRKGRWRARLTFTYYDYFRGGDAQVVREAIFSCDGKVLRYAGASGQYPTTGARPQPGPGLGGLDRYEVASSVSATGWADLGSQRTILLATGLAPADALAASPLAGHLDAPLLLTPPRGLPASVGREIARLAAGEPSCTITIVGPESAVGPAPVAAAVAAARSAGVTGTVTVRRVAGADAAGTAAAVATLVRAPALGLFSRTVFVVNASAYADALSIAPIAARHRVPILYVGRDRVPAATQSALASLGVRHAVVVGGPGSVSPGVETWLESAGYRVAGHPDNAPGPDTRLWGATRYDVSAQAVRWAVEYAEMDQGALGVASGQKWPDALAAGPLLAKRDQPMLLVHGADVNYSPPTAQALAWRRDDPPTFTFFGGPATLSLFARGQAGALAGR